MAYRIEWHRAAGRAFDRLPTQIQARVGRAIDGLAADPRPSGTRSVVSGAGELRLRVGDYRVIYEVDDRAQTVLVVKIAHRGDAYR